MIDEPRITHTQARPAAVIRLTIPRKEIRSVMGPAIEEVVAAATAQGIGPDGAVFSHHLRTAPDVFDFEVGVPVKGEVTPVGRVVPGELPAARVVQTEYHGDYQGLPNAWGEFDAWIAENGLDTAENLWEWYVAGPQTSPDPADWRTELNRPLARG